MQLKELQHRNDIGHVLNALNMTGWGVEVGTFEGENAEKILSVWKVHLILIDPYCYQDESVYCDGSNRVNYDHAYRLAQFRMTPYLERSTFIRQYSKIAAELIGVPLDFVYLDGNHSYEAVVEDLDLWIPKLKPGGIIGGHDFYNSERPDYKCGVQKAVSERFNVFDIHLTACASWFVRL